MNNRKRLTFVYDFSEDIGKHLCPVTIFNARRIVLAGLIHLKSHLLYIPGYLQKDD